MHTTFGRSFAVMAVAALAVSGLSVTASAETPAPKLRPAQAAPATPMAAGVIVTTTSAKPSAALIDRAESELPGKVDVAKVRAKGNRQSVLSTSERITAVEAEKVAAELRRRPDVVSASPNYIHKAFGYPPVFTDDPYYTQNRARQVFDYRSQSDLTVKAVLGGGNVFPTGGYSSRAPYLWRVTKGEDKVVAVVDTGITAHEELPAGRILDGYDLITRYYDDWVGLEDTGRDGDDRDEDPSDEGDWEDVEDYCGLFTGTYPSSWHGTHVAGIVGAQANNGVGLVGVAPQVKILPVRVLGRCGGTSEDIADGIRWAAGLSTPGVARVNDKPADVINLSLGVYVPCTEDPYMAAAVADARAAGSVVVAAAGNDGVNLATYPVSPAGCAGVIAVGATSEYGDRAGFRYAGKKYVYSNYGAAIDIAAPGGDEYWASSGGILSSVNPGRTTPMPVTNAYVRYAGTSMAAPVISAAAALVDSLAPDAPFAPGQIQGMLQAAVTAFSTSPNAQFKKCTTAICGDGILSLAKVPAPISAPSVVGPLTVGEPVSVNPGSWNARPTSFSYVWMRDGVTIAGATRSTYTLTQDDVGTRLSVRIAPTTAAFAPITSTSAETAVVPQGPAVTLTGIPSTLTYGQAATATVTVSEAGGPVNGPVAIRRGTKTLATGTAVDGTVTIPVGWSAWTVGTTPVRAAFLGMDSHIAASSLSAPLTVKQAKSTITQVLPTSISRTRQATLKVTVTAPGVRWPAGTINVYDGSKVIYKFSLTSAYHGTRTVKLPKITKVGTHRIKVGYLGNANIDGDGSTARYLKVY